METSKLKILGEVNKKLDHLQNIMEINLEYDDGVLSSFDLLEEEDVWVQDEEFGKGSRYKTLTQYNKTNDHNLAPVLFEGKKTNLIRTHSHYEAHLFICVSGKIKVTLDSDNESILNSFDTIFVNTYQPHKIEFMEDSQLLILVLNI